MIASEVFVPGMILGILGFGCLVAAVVLSYIEYGALTGTLVLGGVSVACLIGFFIWIFLFPKTVIGRKVTNKNHLANDEPALSPLLGQEGSALTILRPGGTARIGDRRVDVVADETFIDAGSRVKVIRVEGNHVVVRKIALSSPEKS